MTATGAWSSDAALRTAFPDDAPIFFGFEDLQFLFTVTLTGIKVWEEKDYSSVLDHAQARRRLIDLAQAHTILAQAQLRQMGPLVPAKQDDPTPVGTVDHDVSRESKE